MLTLNSTQDNETSVWLTYNIYHNLATKNVYSLNNNIIYTIPPRVSNSIRLHGTPEDGKLHNLSALDNGSCCTDGS